mmetsp:Transcript_46240/g.86298  ORF Transcript_46240/g.86298 Transcript_46240/m.86298 type:complete len:409 (+) Transcript_46240:73-1299(+)
MLTRAGGLDLPGHDDALLLLQAHLELDHPTLHSLVPDGLSAASAEGNKVDLLELASHAALHLQQRLGLCRGSMPAETCLCMPTWTLVVGVAVVILGLFYLVNFILWSRRRRLQRLHNLEATKELSEHGNLLGSLVEMAIEEFDESLFGVDTDFGAVKVIVHEGIVEVHDLTIYNPPGYWSDYFLHVGRTLVDIDMAAYVSSFGKRVVIERVQMQDVDVIWERGMFNSNLLDMQRFSGTGPDHVSPRAGRAKTTLRKVDLEDISLKLAAYVLAGCGPRVLVPDISYDNFEEEAGEARYITQALFLSLIASVLTNVLGRTVASSILDTTWGATRAAADGTWHFLAWLGFVLGSLASCHAFSGEPTSKRERASASSREAKAEPAERRPGWLTRWLCSSPCVPCQAILIGRD